MKKITMLFAVMAAMIISPMVTKAQCGPRGSCPEKETAKKCTKEERKKAGCTKDGSKDADKCDKQAANKGSRCADKSKKCD